MLNIDSRIDINPCIQKFLNILIPFCMTASFGIRMRKFIYKNKLWFSFQRHINVEFVQYHTIIENFSCRKNF